MLLPQLKRYGTIALLWMVCTSFLDVRREELVFSGCFGTQKLVQDKKYFCTATGDSISVSMCRFYISDIVLLSGNDTAGRYGYKLIDLFDTASASFRIPLQGAANITEIRFNLGIDSATNVAGVQGGDLDPTKGMYWAWQSGYINLKLEGRSALCYERNGEFQYHIGGYAAPHTTLRPVVLKSAGNGAVCRINVDVEQFFSHTDLKKQPRIMSPSAAAVALSAYAAEMFSPAP